MPEPRYLFGDDYAYQSYEDNERWLECKVCKQEFDGFSYRSKTCSDCEDEIFKRERERV